MRTHTFNDSSISYINIYNHSGLYYGLFIYYNFGISWVTTLWNNWGNGLKWMPSATTPISSLRHQRTSCQPGFYFFRTLRARSLSSSSLSSRQRTIFLITLLFLWYHHKISGSRPHSNTPFLGNNPNGRVHMGYIPLAEVEMLLHKEQEKFKLLPYPILILAHHTLLSLAGQFHPTGYSIFTFVLFNVLSSNPHEHIFNCEHPFTFNQFFFPLVIQLFLKFGFSQELTSPFLWLSSNSHF